MARFVGRVGYAEYVENAPGVWTETITERLYFGDVLRNVIQSANGEQLNDDINVTHSISIVADEYAVNNIPAIRYVWWQGSRWKVKSFEVRRPRLVLSIGGVYNGPEVGTTPTP